MTHLGLHTKAELSVSHIAHLLPQTNTKLLTYQLPTASTFLSTIMPVPTNTDPSKSGDKTTATAATALEVEKPSTQSVASASHTQKTEAEMQAERLYEERMEEEYAKREGGA